MENLYDYYFHYNIYTKEWKAFLRTENSKYLNGKAKVISDISPNNLIKRIKELEKTMS
jgi:7,8-dihydro-6-hydroxymethylpterin-pyrophosphokinase